MEKLGLKNEAFAQREQRFGNSAASASVALYHWEHLSDHLSTASSEVSDRNQLACAVRAMLASPVVKFMVASKALLGLILQEPFINMIVEQHITRTQCLIVLPALYKELLAPPRDVLDTTKSVLPSLSSSWLADCCPEEQIQKLKDYLQSCDQSAMLYQQTSVCRCPRVVPLVAQTKCI